jgi:hypothetical protein
LVVDDVDRINAMQKDATLDFDVGGEVFRFSSANIISSIVQLISISNHPKIIPDDNSCQNK